ncbi:hypothetical protein GQE99_14425 [Maritimibacter sp. DP07]|uniref:Uncharacterized protein n=1 Tax=Maritimibacter harenae TaxID=2606218 RepID=A0A845M2F5_9RHOB|nr:hypothetical protein [Maritimibacter harenae]MZR14215.1 hypothetical protein [Maritimibacter harenae]
MSQPTTWGCPRAADAPQTPEQVADRVDDSLDALLSNNSGTARPAYAVAGMTWHDSANGVWYLFDGTDDWPINIRSGSSNVLGSVAGTDAITATLTPTLTAYAELTTVLLVTAAANTGAVTLDIDGVGAKSVVKAAGTALSGGDLVSGGAYTLWYDGANDRFQVVGL